MIFSKVNGQWYLLDGEMAIEVHHETIVTHGGTIVVYDVSSIEDIDTFWNKTQVFDIKIADIIIRQNGSKSLQSLSKRYLKKKVNETDPLAVLKCIQAIFEKQKSKVPANYIVGLAQNFIFMAMCFSTFIQRHGTDFYKRDHRNFVPVLSKSNLIHELELSPVDSLKSAFGLSSYFKSLDYLSGSENKIVVDYCLVRLLNFKSFCMNNSSMGYIFETFYIDSFGLPGGACNLFIELADEHKESVSILNLDGIEFRFVLSSKFKTAPDFSSSVYAQIFMAITGKNECNALQEKMIKRILSLMVKNESLIDIEDQLGMRGKLGALINKIDEFLGIQNQIESMAQFACQMGYFKLYNDGILRNRFSEEAKKAYSEAKNLLKPGLYEKHHYDHLDGPERGLIGEYFVTMAEVKKRAFAYYLKSLKAYMIWSKASSMASVGDSIMLINQDKLFYIKN